MLAGAELVFETVCELLFEAGCAFWPEMLAGGGLLFEAGCVF